MRAMILILLLLGLALLFGLYPDIVGQTLRIEAFGWLFETRQGPFITLLLVLLTLLWLLQRLVGAILAGPGQLWRTLRMGSRKRREQRLHEGIGDLIDMRGDLGRRSFAKSKGSVPDWASPLLTTLTIPANEQDVAEQDDNTLNVALAARIATDPDSPNKPDSATRRAHLQAWLAVHADAPLAVSRLAALSEKEGDWSTAVELLEKLWKQGHRSAASIKPRLAHAYIRLAENDSENRQHHLRKAHRLLPDSTEVIIALGRAHLADGNRSAAEKLWLQHLEHHSDFGVARAMFESTKNEALQGFRRIDRKDAAGTYNRAMRWLQAALAYSAGLNGLASEIIDELVSDEAEAEVLRSCAAWAANAGKWKEAAEYYALLDRQHGDRH